MPKQIKSFKMKKHIKFIFGPNQMSLLIIVIINANNKVLSFTLIGLRVYTLCVLKEEKMNYGLIVTPV